MTDTNQSGTAPLRAAKRAEHWPQRHFAVVDNCLHVGGEAITAIADRAEGRAFYVYDRNVMTGCVEEWRRAMPAELHLHYAMKANPMPEVVQHMAGLADGLDVASAGELRLALATGITPETISFAGPGKSDEDLRSAVGAKVIIILESPTEMRRVSAIASELGVRPPVAIRVNPDFELKTSGMKMGGGPKPFGIDAEQVPAVMESMKGLPLDFMGLHIFSGSQNLRADSIVDAHNKTFDLAWRIAEAAGVSLRWLNIGGGLGIPYFPGERPLDLEPIATNLRALLQESKTHQPDAEVVMELGRYLVAEAGLYVSSITDKKTSRGHTFLITNGGLHHHLAASGNFGQVIRKNYPVCIGNRVDSDNREVVSVVGPLCTPLDLLADNMPLPTVEIGDLVVIFQSGAYGYTASPHLFLSHPAPLQFCV